MWQEVRICPPHIRLIQFGESMEQVKAIGRSFAESSSNVLCVSSAREIADRQIRDIQGFEGRCCGLKKVSN